MNNINNMNNNLNGNNTSAYGSAGMDNSNTYSNRIMNANDYYGLGYRNDNVEYQDELNNSYPMTPNVNRVNSSPYKGNACTNQNGKNCLTASYNFTSIMDGTSGSSPTIITPQNYKLIQNQQNLQTITSIEGNTLEYLNGFLRTQIGKYVIVDFYLGSGNTVQKEGYLIGVGSNYIVLHDVNEDQAIAADFYQIKFVTFTLKSAPQEKS